MLREWAGGGWWCGVPAITILALVISDWDLPRVRSGDAADGGVGGEAELPDGVGGAGDGAGGGRRSRARTTTCREKTLISTSWPWPSQHSGSKSASHNSPDGGNFSLLFSSEDTR